MICFIALFVFGILSIFSAKYRPYAKASIDCVFRRVTLRPCNTDLEEQVKSETVALLLQKSPPIAKFVNKRWEAISWAFTILLFASLAYTLFGVYNFAVYGNCDPSSSPEGCIYNQLLGRNPQNLVPPTSLDGFSAGNMQSDVVVVEFGCYLCPFTMRAEPAVLKLIENDGGEFHYIFKAAPVKSHNNSDLAAIASYCANKQGKYWEYRKWLFASQPQVRENGTLPLLKAAQTLGLDKENFSSCLSSEDAKDWLAASIEEADRSNIYQTPTFFVNGKAYVGPLQYGQLKAAVDEAKAN